MTSVRVDSNLPVALITGEGNYTRLHYSNGKQDLLATTLAKVLMRYAYLWRVSKHAAINVDFIESWQRTNKGLFLTISLPDSTPIIKVARRMEFQISKMLPK